MGKPAVTPGNFHEWGKKNHMGVQNHWVQLGKAGEYTGLSMIRIHTCLKEVWI